MSSDSGRFGRPKAVRKNAAHPPCSDVFLASARTASQFAVSWVSAACVRQRSEAVDVDHGQLVRRDLKDVAIVMGLHEFTPVGGRAAGGRDRRRLEWLAEVCEDLTSRGRSHPGLLPLANKSAT